MVVMTSRSRCGHDCMVMTYNSSVRWGYGGTGRGPPGYYYLTMSFFAMVTHVDTCLSSIFGGGGGGRGREVSVLGPS